MFFNTSAASHLSVFTILLTNLPLACHSRLCCKDTCFLSSISRLPQPPSPFLLSCFPVELPPTYIGSQGCYWYWALNFHLLMFMRFLLANFLACCSSGWQHNPLDISHSSQFGVICNHLVICNPAMEKKQSPCSCMCV